MRNGLKAAVAIVGIVGMAFLASAALADMAATYLPPEGDDGHLVKIRLTADRQFGFVPMQVNLSGMAQTQDGDLLPISGGQRIRLVVESPKLTVQSSLTVTRFMPDMHYEAFSPGPAVPAAFVRAIEIRRPGTYTFRVQVVAPDGAVLSSNDVSVRAL